MSTTNTVYISKSRVRHRTLTVKLGLSPKTEKVAKGAMVPAPSIRPSVERVVSQLKDPEKRELLKDMQRRLRFGGAYTFLKKGTGASGLIVWGLVEGGQRALGRLEPFNWMPSSVLRVAMTLIASETVRERIQAVLDYYPSVRALEEKAKERFARLKGIVIDAENSVARRLIKHQVEPRVENLVREKMTGMLHPWQNVAREKGIQRGLEEARTRTDLEIHHVMDYVLSPSVLKHLFPVDLPVALVSASLSLGDVYLGHDQRVARARLKRLGISEATLLNLDDKRVQELVVELDELWKAKVPSRSVRRIKEHYRHVRHFGSELDHIVRLMKSRKPVVQVQVYEALAYQSGSKFHRLAFQLADVGVAYTFAAVTGSSPVGYIAKSLATPGNIVAAGAIVAGTVAYQAYKNTAVRKKVSSFWSKCTLANVKHVAGKVFGLFDKAFGHKSYQS